MWYVYHDITVNLLNSKTEAKLLINRGGGRGES